MTITLAIILWVSLSTACVLVGATYDYRSSNYYSLTIGEICLALFLCLLGPFTLVLTVWYLIDQSGIMSKRVVIKGHPVTYSHTPWMNNNSLLPYNSQQQGDKEEDI